MDWIFDPWPWYVGGPLVAMVLLTTKFFSKRLGVSSSFRAACTIAGAGSKFDFFNIDWKKDLKWMMIMVLGLIIGGYISQNFLSNGSAMELSELAMNDFKKMGIENPGKELLPSEFYSLESLTTLPGFLFVVVGGFLIGFGARYAGGCTSGHAMSGLSELQPASLMAVIGFFIGGVFIVHVILPLIF